MDKTVLHLDMNSYFATAEQQANPSLRGKPVGIVKAEGRGCIIAASIEAKRFGVKTGCTVWDAKKLCPQIILVPSDMDKYFSITEGLIKIVNDYSPTVEVFSIDEMFADVTETQKKFSGAALEIAMEIKWRIKRDLGEWLKCSIGVSFSKLIAKLASEMNKPDGITFLTPEDYIEKTQECPVEDVCGIGFSRTRLLHSMGAFNLGQARKLNLPGEVEELVWLRVEEPLQTVEDLEPAKSVSRTFTTFSEVYGQKGVERLVRNLVEEAAAKLREMNMWGRTVCLSLRSGKEEKTFWARKTINAPTDDGKIIFDLLWKEYLKVEPMSVRFAGVGVFNLGFKYQSSIFIRREQLLKTADSINEKYGLFTVYPGRLLGGEIVRPEVTGYLGDKWYRFGK